MGNPLAHDRRKERRSRSFLIGNARGEKLAMTCVLRDVGEAGARLKVGAASHLPDAFELSVESRKARFSARVVWRHGEEVGVALSPVIDAGLEQRLRRIERARKELRRRIDSWASGY